MGMGAQDPSAKYLSPPDLATAVFEGETVGIDTAELELTPRPPDIQGVIYG